MAKLKQSFFLQSDVVRISRELLGKHVLTRIDGSVVTGGRIVETEAYAGPEDRASHAYGNRRTARTEVMYQAGGIAYVYLCYGIHHLFNIITNVEGIPHAVLIRAIEPVCGIELMLQRRNKHTIDRSLTGGPGALSGALGIDLRHTGKPVFDDVIWLEDRGDDISPGAIIASPRIGVDYAGKDAKRPWRFRLRNCAWTSPAE